MIIPPATLPLSRPVIGYGVIRSSYTRVSAAPGEPGLVLGYIRQPFPGRNRRRETFPVKTLLSWLVPPLAGALIGYITNAIAIKMLFRPLREIRLFAGKKGRGLRLPFTPGILPRERRKLAASIGAMVERELLTPEIIRERLRRETVREAVRKSVAEFLWNASRQAGQSPSQAKAAPFPGGDLWAGLVERFIAWLKTPAIHGRMVQECREIINRVRDRDLNIFQRFFVEAGNYDETIKERMPLIVEDITGRIGALLRDPAFFAKITAALTGGAGPENGGDRSLDRLIAARMLDRADRNIEQILHGFDVKAMVEDRINALEMIRVEKIVLDVMANQFKWINLFGGILGALIGLFQALFYHLLGRF